MNAFLKYLILIAYFVAIVSKVYCECEFPNHQLPTKDLAAYKKLQKLVGKRFDAYDPEGLYVYHVGICTDAIDGTNVGDKAGIIQEKKDGTDQHIIGKYSNTGIMAGTNWVYLEYNDGDAYGSVEHCKKAQRRAVILFTCNPHATLSTKMRMLQEETDVDSGCYYLFELACPEVCENAPATGSFLSVGSIILIVFVVVAAVYLVAGALYQRFVLGAKGIEQLPNYEFWKDFGNLQADGCDFVCRSRDGRRSSPYKGLGDDQLEEPEERDDNLLPM